MNTETSDPAELATLREIFASRPEAAPPAGWEAVRSFEAEHSIVLPEPYRTFVAEICDGLRAGPPYYGLLPLTQTPRDWGSHRPERMLAKPFPLAAAWLWEDDEEALSEQEVEARTDPVFDHGSLLLGTDGCGMYWHLIVTGPQRGHVWQITGEGAMPFGSQSPNALMPGTPGFTGWVTHWAQGRSWFADAQGGDPKPVMDDDRMRHSNGTGRLAIFTGAKTAIGRTVHLDAWDEATDVALVPRAEYTPQVSRP